MESDVSESEDVGGEITNERVEAELIPAFHNILNLFKSPIVEIKKAKYKILHNTNNF